MDNQYEFRITTNTVQAVPCTRTVKTIWFRSTNYLPSSPYGWMTLAIDGHIVSQDRLRKMVEELTECELIPARYDTNERMSKEG